MAAPTPVSGPADRPSHATLRRLADVRSEPDGVLSVYVDLDPSVFPTPADRRREIDVLIGEAEQRFAGDGLAHDERRRRLEAVVRMKETLLARDVAKDATRSVAAFAAPDRDLFEVVRLAEPVPPTVVVGETPYLRPLAHEAGPRTWAVLLVDRRRTRLLWGGPHRLFEVASTTDDTVDRTKVGGWSQARYQRHAGEEAREHLDGALSMLLSFFERARFDALAIAAPDPIYDEVVGRLHAYVRERLRGRVRIEIGHPSPSDVLEAARPLFEQARLDAIDALLDAVAERRRDGVATGPLDTLRALHERRVDTLVLAERYALPGRRCPRCGWLGIENPACPADDERTEPRDDVIVDAIELALQQAARVVQIGEDAPRRPPAPVCALLRF